MKSNLKKLPYPECEDGYSHRQLENIAETFEFDLDDLFKELRGQTASLCEQHGVVTYVVDVKRFLGAPIPWD